jgi:DegV family protein with EDD domain
MNKIALVTDTNSSLPISLSEKYHIVQVPILIQFGEETYRTGVDIDDSKLFEIIDERKVLPTTAAPSPSSFEEAYQRAFSNGADEIICICCSSEVSATFNVATMAKEPFPDRIINVIDSRQLSLAEGFQVLAAAETIAAGGTQAEISAAIKNVRENTHVYAALPTLKYLAMGGRMGKLTAGFGNTLEIKPILTARDGKLDLLEKIRTLKKAKGRLIELARNVAADKTIKRVGLLHVNNEKGAWELFDLLKEALPISVEPIIGEFTPGLSVHSGSGVIGYVLVVE